LPIKIAKKQNHHNRKAAKTTNLPFHSALHNDNY
jgi:hypothetical protein